MAISKWIEIVCDVCGAGTGDLMPSGESVEARKRARVDGWSHRDGEDRCTACTAKRTARSAKSSADTMTIIDAPTAAALLGINRNTLYTCASAGEIPCRRVGRKFLFVREVLVEWLRSKPGTV